MKPIKKLFSILFFMLAVATGMWLLAAFLIGLGRLLSWL
tara:strand:+ start:72 stop:188 length:117 start_codon:yes stop_codon:yes gene_type:complete